MVYMYLDIHEKEFGDQYFSFHSASQFSSLSSLLLLPVHSFSLSTIKNIFFFFLFFLKPLPKHNKQSFQPEHLFCRFWNPFENPSSFRVCAISLFSSLKVQGISKNICLSYLMRALKLICPHSLMPIFLLFPLEIRGMSKNISSFYLLKAT